MEGTRNETCVPAPGGRKESEKETERGQLGGGGGRAQEEQSKGITGTMLGHVSEPQASNIIFDVFGGFLFRFEAFPADVWKNEISCSPIFLDFVDLVVNALVTHHYRIYRI